MSADWLKEWEVARDVIAKADDRVAELRKYGFSFVAGLMTASSLLLHAIDPSKGASTLPLSVAVGGAIAQFLLVAAMYFAERHMKVVQEAAVIRASILERKLGLELTRNIADRYGIKGGRVIEILLYVMFAGAVCVVGLVPALDYLHVTASDAMNIAIIAIPAVAVGIALWMTIFGTLELRRGGADWSMHQTECVVGEDFGITVTNIGSEQLTFTEDQLIWRAVEQSGTYCVEDGKKDPAGCEKREAEYAVHACAPAGLTLRKYEYYTWRWRPHRAGIYEISALYPDEKLAKDKRTRTPRRLGRLVVNRKPPPAPPSAP